MTDSRIAAHLHTTIINTIAVMTGAQEQRAKWCEDVVQLLQQAQSLNRQQVAEFFPAALSLLDGQPFTLPEGHPYAKALATIQANIAAGGQHSARISEEIPQAISDFVTAKDWESPGKVVEAQNSPLFQPEVEILSKKNIARARAAIEQDTVKLLELRLALSRRCKETSIPETFSQFEEVQQSGQRLPFDPELIPRSIAALLGDQQEKMAHAQYLTTQVAQVPDE